MKVCYNASLTKKLATQLVGGTQSEDQKNNKMSSISARKNNNPIGVVSQYADYRAKGLGFLKKSMQIFSITEMKTNKLS